LELIRDVKTQDKKWLIRLMIIKLLAIVLLFTYLLIAHRLFNIWLKFFQQDTSISTEDRSLSWVVLSIGTILWPVIVPIAYLRLLEEKFKHQEVSEKAEEIAPAGRCPERVTASCWN
jgi:flagellar biosynthesis protein FlhB